jgi:hypothetical protein
MEEERKEEWIQSWFTEFNKLIKEDGVEWIEKMKEWEIANPAPPITGPKIIIKKMGT